MQYQYRGIHGRPRRSCRRRPRLIFQSILSFAHISAWNPSSSPLLAKAVVLVLSRDQMLTAAGLWPPGLNCWAAATNRASALDSWYDVYIGSEDASCMVQSPSGILSTRSGSANLAAVSTSKDSCGRRLQRYGNIWRRHRHKSCIVVWFLESHKASLLRACHFLQVHYAGIYCKGRVHLPAADTHWIACGLFLVFIKRSAAPWYDGIYKVKPMLTCII
jgi:hypothetical protein